MLLKLQTTHPFDMNAAQIDIDIILDKKERNLHPSAAKLLSRRDKDNPETTLAVSATPISFFSNLTYDYFARNS